MNDSFAGFPKHVCKSEVSTFSGLPKVGQYDNLLTAPPFKYRAMDAATQVTNQIYIGPLSVARDRKELKRLEVSAVVCAAAEGRCFFPDEFDYWEAPQLAEHSCDIIDILDLMKDLWDFCEPRLQKGEKLFFHCVHGRTRSATMLVYILSKGSKKRVLETYEIIRAKRDVFIPEPWLQAMQAKLSQHESLPIRDSTAVHPSS
ncbi:Protein phosphatase Slingshot homolog 2 [Seminavis robusta]|uniref:Protein phosphatase Slingshot homolog 2 n=1 Tax=Seminavis robusta TaxID=568900 RepID=A0A9N8EEH9_9STRA|nr:Protein phosphatase Slingshot homolog 2 [Seminavis robusta]|eukprot:Sro1008_g230550.1 Protein phosphatase Slingshot homolog 2 (202) ;mRNA; f:18158-18763